MAFKIPKFIYFYIIPPLPPQITSSTTGCAFRMVIPNGFSFFLPSSVGNGNRMCTGCSSLTNAGAIFCWCFGEFCSPIADVVRRADLDSFNFPFLELPPLNWSSSSSVSSVEIEELLEDEEIIINLSRQLLRLLAFQGFCCWSSIGLSSSATISSVAMPWP